MAHPGSDLHVCGPPSLFSFCKQLPLATSWAEASEEWLCGPPWGRLTWAEAQAGARCQKWGWQGILESWTPEVWSRRWAQTPGGGQDPLALQNPHPREGHGQRRAKVGPSKVWG